LPCPVAGRSGSVTGMDAVVFDFDGLILDTETPQFLTVSAAFSQHGVELALDDWRAIVGTADHPHWSEWLADELGERGRDLDLAAVREDRLVEYHARLADLDPLPGVPELLDDLGRADVALAVASSSPLDWVEGHLERLDLLERFASLHTREHVERTKPAPDLFRRALEHLDAAPARSVALEDSPHGVTAAKAAGMAVVACPNDITRGGDFGAADLVVDSLAAVSPDDLAALLPSGS
ncbi:MAG: HAD family hydrolase, partial [Actinomycetota bacterium]